ncbi:acyl-CoA dehydrogenase family protein [Nocardia sp. R6R-6]|uniref:acyl-CoA dehydrogenase family protein n=1 Tax=Nocardia sp. R6R-6 TaxID=3459303 RepID=UPI00403D938A
MRWELTEEQELFRESFAGWLDRFAPPESVRKWLESGDSSVFDTKFAKEGWFAVGLPEPIGGQGGGLLELALTAEELGRHAAPSSTWFAAVLTAPLLPAETAGQVLSGELTAALAVDASRAADTATTFRISEDGALSGAVATSLGADQADLLVVPARGPDGPGLYLVNARDNAVSVAPRKTLDRSRRAADVRLTGAAGLRLDLDAESALADVALRAAVLTAADALGAMERMLDLAVSYSKTRQQFGAPIGSFQAVKHAAATMLVSVEAARSIVYFAAQSVQEQHSQRTIHAAVAKAQVTPSAVVAADSALTLHGAVGYTWEHDLHLYYKRAKLDAQLFGSAAVWNGRLADLLPLVAAAQ